MIHLFCGYDEREAVGYHVFCQSVVARASNNQAAAATKAMKSSTGNTNGKKNGRRRILSRSRCMRL